MLRRACALAMPGKPQDFRTHVEGDAVRVRP